MRKSVFSAVAVAAVFLASFSTSAHDFKVGSLKIDHPWARPTPAGAKVGGGFLKITNEGTEVDRLVSGSSPAARTFEIHEMKHEGGVMKMRALERGLEIKPGETVELKPGGLHVMFIDLNAPLKEGEIVKGELVFEKAGKVQVEYKIERGASGHGAHQHHQHTGPGK